MKQSVLSIKRWGNSLGVRLPVAVTSAAHLHLDQQVRIEVANGQVIITPITDVAMTLEQRLALFDPKLHSGEVMVTKAIGAERW